MGIMAATISVTAETASIRATATVVTPLGLLEESPARADSVTVNIDGIDQHRQCLYLRHPHDIGLICTVDAAEHQPQRITVSPGPSIDRLIITPPIITSDTCLITVIYTEN